MSTTPFVAIAIHHHDPDHEEAFLSFMHRVIDATEGAPGLLEFRPFKDANGRFLAGFSRWESEQAFRDALSRITSLAPDRDPAWSTQPDELITLTAAD
jgi:quinol monooxygenase YgiN